MGIMVYSLFWVMQDLYHQPYLNSNSPTSFRVPCHDFVKNSPAKKVGFLGVQANPKFPPKP